MIISYLEVMCLRLCHFFKGLFVLSRHFFKGLFALSCHFFKGLLVQIYTFFVRRTSILGCDVVVLCCCCVEMLRWCDLLVISPRQHLTISTGEPRSPFNPRQERRSSRAMGRDIRIFRLRGRIVSSRFRLSR